MNTADRQAGKTSRLMRPGHRHLVRAGPSRADHGGLASVRRVRGRDLLGHRERISAPDRLAARRRHSRADRHTWTRPRPSPVSRMRACCWS